MAKRGDVFQSIPVGRIGRSNFNLSHQLTGNFKEGICYPVFCEETLPGDSWRINTYNISKLETLIAPAMQRTNASLLWFKIPKRLCMKNFKKWYSGGKDGNANVEKPYFKLRSFVTWLSGRGIMEETAKLVTDLFFGPGSVWQMVGLPIPYLPNELTGQVEFIPPYTINEEEVAIPNWPDATLDQKIDLIPFIAYAKLYDEYFMDQTLSESIFISDEDYGSFNPDWEYEFDTPEMTFVFNGSNLNVFEGGEFDFNKIIPLFIAFRRAWQKDYFTSALPTPQRGPEVTINLLEGSAPVELDPNQTVVIGNKQNSTTDNPYVALTSAVPGSEPVMFDQNSSNYGHLSVDGNSIFKIEGKLNGYSDNIHGTADLSGLSPISIVAFRNLFKLQAFLEKNNVAGGRFIEFILAHWAERVPDFTIQRPIFVRATQIPVIVSEVTATANSEGINAVVGDQAGRAKGQGNLGSCRIYTQEPSIIIGIYCVTPPPSYVTQGIPKKFQRMTRWDEPYFEFQHIGEQAILEKEIFVPWRVSDDTDPEEEFGYQQRYSEFKYLPDRVVGEFATNLSYWHQARMFTRAPRLNQTFIENNPSDRIFAVENQNPVIADFWFDIKCSRKLSKFSTPKLN